MTTDKLARALRFAQDGTDMIEPWVTDTARVSWHFLARRLETKLTPDFMGDVRAFHEKFQQAYDGAPRTWLLPNGDVEQDQFRINFMREEVDEYDHNQVLLTHGGEHDDVERRACDANRLDALADVVFVAIGTAYLHGWNFNEAWRRVVRANMAKEVAAGEGDDIGKWKIRKPSGWVPPDHTDLV